MEFRDIYRKAHAGHASCLRDEWLSTPCPDRPIVWSRRNGPWQEVELLWVGAAPGNAGGKGSGNMGAHGTRIPFGGDLAGANLEVLFTSIGITRNDTFITAALNQLPEAGGGEPTFAEISAPVGDYESSLHLLRDTILAAHPRMIIALGNVALRSIAAACRLEDEGVKLPTQARLEKAGLARNVATDWPDESIPDDAFLNAWGKESLPALLWLTHPSAQNMSPYARKSTLFHTRMLEARDALKKAVKDKLHWRLPGKRPEVDKTGIYALPEWKELIGPRHDVLDALWREKGI